MDTFNGFMMIVLFCKETYFLNGSHFNGLGPAVVMISSSIQFFAGLSVYLKPYLFPTLPRFHNRGAAAA